jgi:hypothetical protein
MTLREQRRALEMLAGAGESGSTLDMLVTNGFPAELLAGLVSDGLAMMQGEKGWPKAAQSSPPFRASLHRSGRRHHDQLLCNFRLRVGNADIVHIVVLEFAVLVRLYGRSRFIVVTQLHDLVANLASPRRHRLSPFHSKREGGLKAAFKYRCSPLSCSDRKSRSYSMISTMRRLPGSTMTGRSFTIVYR